MTRANQLRAAAARLRDVAPKLGGFYSKLAGPVADLLDDQADGDDAGEINPWALAVARAVLGTPDQQP